MLITSSWRTGWCLVKWKVIYCRLFWTKRPLERRSYSAIKGEASDILTTVLWLIDEALFGSSLSSTTWFDLLFKKPDYFFLCSIIYVYWFGRCKEVSSIVQIGKKWIVGQIQCYTPSSLSIDFLWDWAM